MRNELLNAEALRALSQLDAEEQAMLKCIVSGFSLRGAAETIAISLDAARQIKLSMMRKLDAACTADLVRIGLYAGFDPTEGR